MHGLEGAQASALARLHAAGAHPHRRRQHRVPRQGLDYRADDYMAKPFSLQRAGSPRARPHPPGMSSASTTSKARPADLRPGRARRHHRQQMVELSTATRPAGSAAATRRPPGQQKRDQLVEHLCEMGRRSEQQRHRGVHPPPAQKIEKGRSASPPCAAWAYCLEKSPIIFS